MKEGRSLVELAEELTRQRQSMRDFKAPTKKLALESDNSLTIGKEIFHTNHLFLNQLAGWAGIPKKYFDRMQAEAPQLLARNVNHWLEAQSETRLVRTMDHTARAFLSHRYRCIDNVDIVETVLPVFEEYGIASVSQEVTLNHLYLKAVNERRTVDLKVGEKVQFGVCISNSEVGLGAVHVDPLVLTLSCLNGAVIADSGLRKFHIGRRVEQLEESFEVFQDDTVLADNKAFFLKLRDVVKAALDEATMTEIVDAINEGAQRRIGDGKNLEEVVEITSSKYGLSQLEADGVLRRLIDGRQMNQWGLSSAITAMAQTVDSYERSTDLEKLGGEILTLPETEWRELAA